MKIITAFENVYLECLKFNASNYANEKTLNLLNNLGLLQFKNQPIKYLSKGQQARVSFAKTIAQNADIYIFDEPTLGLDIVSSSAIVDFMRAEKERGKAVLYSTHYMEEAEVIVTHSGVNSIIRAWKWVSP